MGVHRLLAVLLPVLVVALVGATAVQQWHRYQDHQQSVYYQAEAALASGDLDAAALGFGALGGYRDAPERLQDVRAVTDPVDEQLDAVIATIALGDYRGAISMLEEILSAAPGYSRAIELLDSTRASWISQLERTVGAAEANRDWLEAELALRQLSGLRPDDAEIASQLAAIVRDHATLAFARDGAIFLASPDGLSERSLTGAIGATFPSWSPDRSRIAFITVDDTGNWQRGSLMVVDGDGGNLHTVATDVLPYSWPVWSPDGTRIAFASVRNFDSESFTGEISLNVVDLKSGAELDLTGDQLAHAAVPSWSPDGTEIAFVSNLIERRSGGGVALRDGDVFVVSSAGGPVRNLTEGRVYDESWVQWSPAGGRMAIFTAPGDWSAPAKSRLFLFDLTTDELSEIPIDEWQTSLPFWSPDGSKLAYVTGGNTVNIWSDDGLQWLQLGRDVVSFCSWSPDGRFLVVPPVAASSDAFLIDTSEHFGSVRTFRLDFDGIRGIDGLLVWGGITPPAPPDAEAPPS